MSICVNLQKNIIGGGDDALWNLYDGDGLSTLLSPQLLKAKFRKAKCGLHSVTMTASRPLLSFRAGVAHCDGDEAQEPLAGNERERGQQRGRLLGPNLRQRLLNVGRRRDGEGKRNGRLKSVPLKQIDRLINNKSKFIDMDEDWLDPSRCTKYTVASFVAQTVLFFC